MYPWLHIAGKSLPTYALMALVGALIAGWFAEYQAEKKGVHPFYMVELLLIAVIGVLAGGHLLFGLVHLDELDQGLAHVFGGNVFYGGMIGGVLTGWFVHKKKGYPVYPFYDLVGCTIPLFHGFARIGCFLAGCCYGIESEIGFFYDNAMVPGANGVVRFPVQLLEAGCNFVLFFVLYLLFKNEKFKDKLLYVYLGGYAIIRFCMEFLRGDDFERGVWFGISTSQWISMGLLVFAIFMLARSAKKAARSEKS